MSQSGSGGADNRSKPAVYFNKWVEGLVGALIWADGKLSRRRHFELRTHLHRLTLVQKGAEAPAVFSRDTTAFVPIPQMVLQVTQGSLIGIIVPNAAIIERQLDPMPAESRPYIANVVQHQIDTIFPWRAADVLYSTEIERRSDGMLDVTVRATSRAAIKNELALAKDVGADEVFVTTDSASTSILALVGAGIEVKLSRARFVAHYAAVLVLVLCVSVAGWSIIERWSLTNDVAALDETIAARQALIKRGSDLAATRGAQGLGHNKWRTPAVVVMLDELSTILPDNTYLTDLSLDGSRLRITGVSANAVDLPVLLEKSRQFENVSFYAPTTRIENGALDRFSIEASLVQQGKKP
jgi:general secretion pathway protein L